jgi:hypothetical protein
MNPLQLVSGADLKGSKLFAWFQDMSRHVKIRGAPLENEEILQIKSTFPFSWLQKECLIFLVSEISEACAIPE